MDPKVVAFIVIGIRSFTFICLLIALVVIATDKLALIDGYKATFNDIHGYRFWSVLFSSSHPSSIIFSLCKFTTYKLQYNCAVGILLVQVRVVHCNYRVGPYNITAGFLPLPCAHPKHTILEWPPTIQLLRRPGWWKSLHFTIQLNSNSELIFNGQCRC